MAAEGDVDKLVMETFFYHGRSGIMVEVGAAKPDYLSIGRRFRAAGWRVISIEPNPEFAKLHRDLNHEIVEVAAADEDADDVDFTVAKANTDLDYRGGAISAESFSSLGIRGKYQQMLEPLSDKFDLSTIKVKARRLDTIFSSIPPLDRIDVLTLDVEGWELNCLKGFSFGRLAPKIAIVENLFEDPALERFLALYGYQLWRRLEPNDVYARGDIIRQVTPMISYTPNFEDVLLDRCFKDVRTGFYVDVGAHHPTNASVTRWFYDRGWSGINIEPDRDGIAALRAERPRDINIEAAVSDFVGRTTFYVHSANTGTSTLSSTPAEIVAEKAGPIHAQEVRVTTLERVLSTDAKDKLINFLKIDAEGAENAIVRSTNWRLYRPEVIVIESTEPYTNVRRSEEWQGILSTSGYEMVHFDGVNDFWIRKESSELRAKFVVPVNVLDFFKMYDPETESLRAQLLAATAQLHVSQEKLRRASTSPDSSRPPVKKIKRMRKMVKRFWKQILGRSAGG